MFDVFWDLGAGDDALNVLGRDGLDALPGKGVSFQACGQRIAAAARDHGGYEAYREAARDAIAQARDLASFGQVPRTPDWQIASSYGERIRRTFYGSGARIAATWELASGAGRAAYDAWRPFVENASISHLVSLELGGRALEGKLPGELAAGGALVGGAGGAIASGTVAGAVFGLGIGALLGYIVGTIVDETRYGTMRRLYREAEKELTDLVKLVDAPDVRDRVTANLLRIAVLWEQETERKIELRAQASRYGRHASPLVEEAVTLCKRIAQRARVQAHRFFETYRRLLAEGNIAKAGCMLYIDRDVVFDGVMQAGSSLSRASHAVGKMEQELDRLRASGAIGRA